LSRKKIFINRWNNKKKIFNGYYKINYKGQTETTIPKGLKRARASINPKKKKDLIRTAVLEDNLPLPSSLLPMVSIATCLRRLGPRVPARQITVVRRPRTTTRARPAIKTATARDPAATTTATSSPAAVHPKINVGSIPSSPPPHFSSPRRYDASVLDAVFQDRNKQYLQDQITATFGSKNRKFLVPTSPEAVNGGLLPASPQAIRGVPIFLVQLAYAQRFLHSVPVASDGPNFRGYYFPPWHFVSLARKTSPALIMTYGPGKEYNGAPEYTRQAAMIAQRQMLTKNPFSYAFSRKQTMQALRQALWKAITRDPGHAVDGTYFFVAKRLPTDSQALEQEMVKYVRTCYNLATSKRGLDWVDKFNERVNWRGVSAECARRLFPVPNHTVHKGHGLFWTVPKDNNESNSGNNSDDRKAK
jgi:hypothetical protein